MKKRLATIAVLLLFLSFAASNYRKQSPDSDFDLRALGKIPVVHNGRIKPMDTIARNALLIIGNKSSTIDETGQRYLAIEWLAKLMMNPQEVENWPTFRIYDEDIRGYVKHAKQQETRTGIAALLLGQGSSRYNFSIAELKPHFSEIETQARNADRVEAKLRTHSQKAVIQLYRSISLYISLRNSLYHHFGDSPTQEIKLLQQLIPTALSSFRNQQNKEPFDEQSLAKVSQYMEIYNSIKDSEYFLSLPLERGDGIDWEKPSSTLDSLLRGNGINPIALAYAKAIDAYKAGDAQAFNGAIGDLRQRIDSIEPSWSRSSGVELLFNYVQPFYLCMVGYLMVFLLVIISWIRWPENLNRAAFCLAVTCLALHSVGLGLRIYISGYAPVTNLYSSAVFVGWGAAILALILESIFRNSIGNATTAIIGFCTLLIAHHMSDDGDTMEMMRAVLDSNFWLSTHVTIVTLGYSATFVAGGLAALFMVLSVFTHVMDKSMARSFKSMVYGIVCFATLFSFVGTILGGIWGDQSWGRFWGWDPKENGAALVVLWNILILHARWGGYIKTRGLMAMAIFGNIVTAWSWFGVNMLGIGLHSYGFMDSAFWYLTGFVASQLLLIAIAYSPQRFWKSPIKL